MIIGATGQIGSLSRSYFSNLNCEVSTLSRFGNNLFPLFYESTYFSLLIESEADFVIEFAKLIKNNDIDHILHCASPRGNMRSLAQEEKELIKKVNFDLTQLILDSILASNLNTSVTFLASSAMFTPRSRRDLIDEKTPHSPNSYYGEVKSQTVQLLDLAREQSGVKSHSLILFNQESHLRKSGFLFYQLAHQIAEFINFERKTIEVVNKSYSADWSDARDLPSLINICYETSNFSNLIVSSGKAQSIEELIMNCSNRLLLNLKKSQITSDESQLSDQFTLIGDPSKAALLGWQGTRNVAITLSDFVHEILSYNS